MEKGFLMLLRLLPFNKAELTYDLKVYITIPRRRKFKINAASKIAGVFLLPGGKVENWGKTENQ